MMAVFRVLYKLLALSYLSLEALSVMFYYSLGAGEVRPNAKQKAYRKRWLQRVVKAVGLDVQVRGAEHKNPQAALWVSNHISWMDIAVVGSQGVAFLSKSEVRKWPVIGWLGNQGGTVFIQRGSKNAAKLAGEAIANTIHKGDSILVFPEGTVSKGETVQRFHARIFAPALDHQLTVQPLAVQYLDEQGKPHPKAIWLKESFMRNVLGVLAAPRIRVVLTFLPPLHAADFNERRKIAEKAEHSIRDIVLNSK